MILCQLFVYKKDAKIIIATFEVLNYAFVEN